MASRFSVKQRGETLSALNVTRMWLSSFDGYVKWASYVYAANASKLIDSDVPVAELLHAPVNNTFMLLSVGMWIARRVLIPYSERHTSRD